MALLVLAYVPTTACANDASADPEVLHGDDCVMTIAFDGASYWPLFVDRVTPGKELGTGVAENCSAGSMSHGVSEPAVWTVYRLDGVPAADAVVVPDTTGRGGIVYISAPPGTVPREPELRALLREHPAYNK